MTIWPEIADCGVYLVWPNEGLGWIHPDDVARVERWIPSTRVFRRHSFDGEYYRLQYGEQVVRVKPTMWRRVDDEGFSIGDRVEGGDSCYNRARRVTVEMQSDGVPLYSEQ